MGYGKLCESCDDKELSYTCKYHDEHLNSKCSHVELEGLEGNWHCPELVFGCAHYKCKIKKLCEKAYTNGFNDGCTLCKDDDKQSKGGV